jgi:hypothetical protein
MLQPRWSAWSQWPYPAEKATRAAIRALMESVNVDLWINGHDHTAQVACSAGIKGAGGHGQGQGDRLGLRGQSQGGAGLGGRHVTHFMTNGIGGRAWRVVPATSYPDCLPHPRVLSEVPTCDVASIIRLACHTTPPQFESLSLELNGTPSYDVAGNIHQVLLGGYDLHALRPEEQWPHETLYANSTYHGFAVHRVTANSIATYFVDEHGSVQHEFAIAKNRSSC